MAETETRQVALRKAGALIANLDWRHLLAELVVVVVGVFLGMQVSNWNEERREQKQFETLLVQLKPNVQRTLDFVADANAYYGTTGDYAKTAMAGWAGEKGVSDRDFVVAVYQASQIIGSDVSSENWAAIFGGTQVFHIRDPDLRRALIKVTSRDNDSVTWEKVATAYRENVRRAMPEDIQQAIRDQCGDQVRTDEQRTSLPAECALDFPEDKIAAAARVLRSRPELAEDLRWHLSEVGTFLFNLSLRDQDAQILMEQIVKQED